MVVSLQSLAVSGRFLFFISIRYSIILLLCLSPFNLVASILDSLESPRTSFPIPFNGLCSLLPLLTLALV
ncbi:unnamed protein product, partial [Vitis vinifera]|uniref:Uncharacterized protein n=1 Tax=Vitis vinifera TaxID=29760 RepID=D7TG29_VITVI